MAYIVEVAGDNLAINVNGARLIAIPTGMNIWTLSQYGDLRISILGDTSLQLRTSESVAIGYPTSTGVWIVNATLDPPDPPDPPDPIEGSYSWPYKPNWLDHVTSEFGPRNGRFHEGIDFSGGPAVFGEPIPAIGDGTARNPLSGTGFGNHTIIDHGFWHGFHWISLYAHMRYAPIYTAGDHVDKGDTIGYVNNTGSSLGSHLHMQIHRSVAGNLIFDNGNPSYRSRRNSINPRTFFNSYGDGLWIIS